LEKWEVSVKDYEMLQNEAPGDDEVSRALMEAKSELKKQRGPDAAA
jgi:DnaJ family protein C protein 7